ncbi:unnamed protein product [Cylindrotheca closterium]|uniref:SMP-LTD domain-containing protein n=1 Tax=Cylindrotheca closterium TaxID=2856 RepID=A0AAD2JP09_9STRA|nr:unnamed protein product [Cylindrotheca closterium]
MATIRIYAIIAYLFLQLIAVVVHGSTIDHDSLVATKQRQQQQQQRGIRGSNENYYPRDLIQSFSSNFPSITRDLHPQELKLKAHSSVHLGDRQSEIFSSLESVLTPYFQEILGDTLVAYDLKVKYSEGENVDLPDIIVTNMLVSCILTVRTNSVEELKLHTHAHANSWFFDFFDGLNVYKFLGQLRDNDIEVGELVFQDEEFRSPLLGGGVLGGDLDVGSISLGPDGSPQSGGQAGAIAGAFVGVMVVAGVLAYRYKEKIPWDKIHEKSLGGSSITGSLASSSAGSSSKRTAMTRLSNGIERGVEAGKRLSETVKSKVGPKLEVVKSKVGPRLDAVKSTVGPKLDAAKSNLAPKLDAAKSKFGFLQERVSMYKNNGPNSTAMKMMPQEVPDSPESAARKNRTSLLDSNPYNPFQDHHRKPAAAAAPSEGTYSVGGDFGVGDEYEASILQRSPTISSYSGYGGREIVFGNDARDDEFSMPDDYNTVVADDYSVHCHSILGLMDQPSVDEATILSRKPSNDSEDEGGDDEDDEDEEDYNDDDDDDDDDEQGTQQQQQQQQQEASVTASVPQSPYFTDMDEWSMDGYSLASRPAARNGRGAGAAGRSNLNMPHLR